MSVGKKLRIVELYAGTGRSIQPFRQWRKTEPALLVDASSHAAEVYRHNFHSANYLVADLSYLSSKSLQQHAGGRVDILLGCPPCQGYSDNGPRKSSDPRNAHITRFLNYVRDLRPSAVALENVPLAAISDRFQLLTVELERLGYRWTATIANAALFGSCQSRQRLVLVAVHKRAGAAPVVPKPTHGQGKYFNYSIREMCRISEDPIGLLGVTPGTQRVMGKLPVNGDNELIGQLETPTVWDTIGDLPSIGKSAAKKLDHFQWAHTPSILKRMGRVSEGSRWTGGTRYFSQTYGRLHRKGLARTITTFFPNPGSGRFWHPTENRSLTLREAARIQGFPDDFGFIGHPSKSCTLVGNALDSAIAALTYRIIRSSLD
jgi:DNA (cytosine-5)-methyltransferase 1